MQQSLNLSKVGLLGREAELQQLRFAAEHCKEATMIALVAGFSGTGKSHLVHAFSEEMLHNNPKAYFLGGKFDYEGGVDPFSSLADVLSVFCKQFLERETPEDVKAVRDTLIKSVGGNFQGLLKAIPALAQILSTGNDQSTPDMIDEVAETSMAAAAHRIRYQFISFMGAICSKDRLIVLFLDDIQWADNGSLHLITTLLTDESLKSFLFVGAYRDNEVDGLHPLMEQLEIIREKGRSFVQINIGTMTQKLTERYVAEVLSTEPERVTSLSQSIFAKTRGNIFHTKTALLVLEQTEILNYSYISNQWEWDIQRLQSEMVVSANIVEASIRSLTRLTPNLQNVLRTASFLRSSFDVAMLARLIHFGAASSQQLKVQVPTNQLKSLCDELVARDFLKEESPGSQRYRFSHDRIREAAHMLVDAAEVKQVTLQIGEELIALSTQDGGEQWMFFSGVDHINSLPSAEKEIDFLHLVELNHKAATKATGRSDFVSALTYLKRAIQYMETSDSPWTSHYDKCLTLHNMAAKVSISIGDFQGTEAYAEKILSNAAKPHDKLASYMALGEGMGCQARHKEALDIYRKALSIVDPSIPKRFLVVNALADVQKLKSIFKKMTNEDVLSLPTIQDPDMVIAIRIITEMVARAYFSRETMLSILCMTRSVMLTLKHGLSPPGCMAFATYGSMLCGPLKDLSLGLRFGKMSLAMLKMTKGREFDAKVLMSVAVQIDAWVKPLGETQQTLLKAYRAGMETGDNEFGFFAAINYQIHSFMIGIPLGPILDESNHFINRIDQFGTASVASLALPLHAMWMCFAGRRDVFEWLDSIEETVLQRQTTEPSDKPRVIWTLISSGIAAYHFREYSLAEKCWLAMRPLIAGVASYYAPLLDLYYFGLISAARFRQTRKFQHRSRAKSALKKMKMLIEKQSSGLNGLHCFQIMIADCASSFGGKSRQEVKKLFDTAIKSSSRAGFVHDAGLANELSGEYYFSNGDTYWARHYFIAARECFQRWGADARCKFLTKRRHNYFDKATEEGSLLIHDSASSTTRMPLRNIYVSDGHATASVDASEMTPSFASSWLTEGE